MTKSTAKHLVARVHADPASVDGAAWNALLQAQSAPTPFMRHEYLLALHSSGSAVPRTGWAPQWLTVHEGDVLVAGCPLYLKGHSYGEYVFDWAWADAYERHGLAYYPKLLCAVPFTPTPGTRLLARDAAAREVLVRAIGALAREMKLSSAHVLFLDDVDQAAMLREGWMARSGVQFHWSNREPAYESFDAFLAGLAREKRKKIAQERRRVAEAGITFTVHHGEEIDESLWDFFHHCYTLTYRAHHSTPYLTRAFFATLARTLPRMWVMFVARRGSEPVGASLVAVDTDRGCAWGRYWGAVEYVPCLHFDACYYQPLAWCIEHGLRSFEGGAQGEHKMARGLMPVATASAHWLADARFASAVSDFLERESAGIEMHVDELRERSPYRQA
jgi:predicted N-acyltransferase